MRMKMKTSGKVYQYFWGLTISFLLLSCPVIMAQVQSEGQEKIIEQRNRLVRRAHNDGAAAVPELLEILDNENETLRLTAAHLIVRLGESGREAVEAGLGNDDPQVRRIMIDTIVNQGRLEDFIETILTDEYPPIRRKFRFSFIPEQLLSEESTLSDELIETFSDIYGRASEEIRGEIAEITAEYPPTDKSLVFFELMTGDESPEVVAVAADAIVDKMDSMLRKRNHESLIAEFADFDFSGWPASLIYRANYVLGESYRQLGKGEKAEEAFAAALEIEPNRRALLGRARNYRDYFKDFERSLETYRAAVKTDVGHSGHLLYSSRLEGAMLLRRAGEFDEALNWVEPGLELRNNTWRRRHRNNYAGSLQAQGDQLREQGKDREALDTYRRILNMDDLSESLTEAARKAVGEMKE